MSDLMDAESPDQRRPHGVNERRQTTYFKSQDDLVIGPQLIICSPTMLERVDHLVFVGSVHDVYYDVVPWQESDSCARVRLITFPKLLLGLWAYTDEGGRSPESRTGLWERSTLFMQQASIWTPTKRHWAVIQTKQDTLQDLL